MNTSEAATKANVTIATIRTWCRIGAVTATKTAGRWNIDTTSLAARITIGAMKRRPTRRPITLSIDNMVAIGGRRWQKNDMDRVYINDWATFAGIETSHYKSGNIASASIGGRGIANGRVGRILGTIDKVWFDTADGQLHARHYGARELEIRYLSGERDHIDLIDRVFTGIRTAVAAL